jgi:hypothetical protein
MARHWTEWIRHVQSSEWLGRTWDDCEKPEGYLADDGVSGTEWRDGESSEGLRRVCTWSPMFWETVDESGGHFRTTCQ